MDFLQELGTWPSDPRDQQLYLEKLATLLNTFAAFVIENSFTVITLESQVEPTQQEWEVAYLAQSGLSGLIPPSATLLWIDSTSGTTGGIYGTILGGDGTVFPRVGRNSSGSICDLQTSSFSPITEVVQSVSMIGEFNPGFEALTVSLPKESRLELIASVDITVLNINNIDFEWGADFLINGEKVGTTYRELGALSGLATSSTAGTVVAYFLTPVLPRGEYTVDCVVGMVNELVEVILDYKSGLFTVKGIVA